MTVHPVGGVCFAAAGLALAAAASSSQAAWEKVFSDSSTTTNVEIRAIERLTVNATSTRVYIAGKGGFPGLAPVRMELAFWDGLGNRTHRHEYLDTSAGSHFELRSLHQMANGDYLIAGSSTVGSGQRQFVMRVDADLRPIWNRTLSHSVPGSGAIEAIELPSGDIMVMDVVTLNGFACTRLTKWTGAGGYFDSRALTGPGGENVVLNDIDLDPATQMLWGAGTFGSLDGSACLAVIPAQTGFPGPYTLAVYVDPAVSSSTFNAVAFNTVLGSSVYAAGTSTSFTFPSVTTEVRIVRITNTTTMAPAQDFRFPVNFVPAPGGLSHEGEASAAQPDEVWITGSSVTGHRARHMRLRGGGLSPVFLSGHDYGGPFPRLTNFRGLAFDDPSGNAVMVGSSRANSFPGSEYEPYIVATGSGGATDCSTAWFAQETPVGTGFHKLTGAMPDYLGPGGIASIMTLSIVALPVIEVGHVHFCWGCEVDMTTGAVPGQPGYGVPNGVLNNDDFFFFLANFSAGNLGVADLTTTAVPGTPGYGVPNGVINNDDFFYYLALFSAGC